MTEASYIKLAMLANTIGFGSYAAVLLYYSVIAPAKKVFTRNMRIFTGCLATLLATNILLDAANPYTPENIAIHFVFRISVAISAFYALKKHQPE